MKGIGDNSNIAEKASVYPDDDSRSSVLYGRARRVLPSGNSRHTIFFRPYPVYAKSGNGCRVTDEDGVERIDFVNNFTSLIHGHQPPEVIEAVQQQLSRILAVGLPTESEVLLAELLVERLEGVEQVRFVNSGTEAVMMAIKAARGFTGRSKIAKAEGAYHGAYDFAEISQASRPESWGPADRPASTSTYLGQPHSVCDEVITLPWNNITASRAILGEHKNELAAVLIDPLPSRLAYSAIGTDYLAMLREFCSTSGALFVMDEVYSLRLGYNGAQGKLGFAPDITALGKIIGGGFPVGAVGGRGDIMSVFDLEGGAPRVMHGGTYNANPITMVAGLRSMQLLTPQVHARVDSLGQRMRDGLRACLKKVGRTGQVTGDASLSMLSLSDRPLTNYRDVVYAEKFSPLHARVHCELLNRGVLASPSLGFTLSTAMGVAEVDYTLEQVTAALRAL